MTSTRTALALVIAASVLTANGSAEALPDGPSHLSHRQVEAAAKRAQMKRVTARLGQAKSDSWAPLLGPSPIDALHYDLDLVLDLDREVIAGTVTIELAATLDGLSSIHLDADQGLNILSVLLLEKPSRPYDSPLELAFNHSEESLEINLPKALADGEIIRLLVSYGGEANRNGNGVNFHRHATGEIVHTFAEPFGARVWWPCNDRPDDKATVDLRVTAPEDLVVASNGLETERLDNNNGTSTTTWSSQYPVASYLVVMNVSNFTVSEVIYDALDGSTMPVVTFAYPQLAAQAEQELAVTPEILAVFAERFGEYPFVEEKYGNVTTPFGGGMEHQTLTTISANAVAQGGVDFLNAHEAGHQWWGDWVTNDDWRELWLNEGFASYAEWLWAEHLGGSALAEIKNNDDGRGYFSDTVYDNPTPFSRTIYNKGAWVLHMLRVVVGDDVFFSALADYRARFGGDSATTEGLLEVFQEAWGQDLQWFFDQWVYGVNRPRYQYDWSSESGPAIRLTLTQEQSNAPLFAMPLEVEVTTTAGVESFRIDTTASAEQEIIITLQADPVAVVVDPNHETLAEISPASSPDLDFGPDYPGPFAPPVTLAGSTANFTVPFSNLGGSDLVINSLSLWIGNDFNLLSPTSFPLTIAPGASIDVELRFRAPSPTSTNDFIFVNSNDPSRAGFSMIPLTGTSALTDPPFAVAATSLGLGSVPVGGVSEASINVLNFGRSDLLLETAVSGEAFALSAILPPVISAGGREQLVIRFTPTDIGRVNGVATLTTNDPLRPTLTIALSGEGIAAPKLTVSPSRVALGVGNEQRRKVVTVSNNGQETLLISTVDIGEPFSIDLPQLPLSLAPGTSAEIEVAVAAALIGPASARLRILSNDPGATLAVVPVEAFSTSDPAVETVLAAAARVAGLGNAQWFTDMVVLNPTTDNHGLDLLFRPSTEAPAGQPDLSLDLPANGQRSLTDIVSAAGRQGAGGFSLSASSDELVILSRTYSRDGLGTYGQLIAATGTEANLSSGQKALLPGLSSGGFHSNVGVLNLGESEIEVTVEFFTNNGERLGTHLLTAPAGEFFQRTRVLRDFTANDQRGAFAIVSSTSVGANYQVFASVVDDGSHDPSFIPASTVNDLAGSADNELTTDLMIAVVASNPGDQDTRWSSELSMINPTTGDATIEITFLPADGSASSQQTTVVAAGAGTFLPDVVAAFSADGSGWIRIESDTPGLVSVSRTFNDAPDGTFGQTILGQPLTGLAGAGDMTLLAGLTSVGNFRTNLVISSASATDTTVLVEIFAEDGTALGEITTTVPAMGVMQLNRILGQHLGIEDRAWARISSDDDNAAYSAAASVIDGSTGDPVFNPGVVATTARR